MRLLAVDGDSVLRQAWEASADDQRTGVYRGVANHIAKSIPAWGRVIVAFDGGPGGGVGGFRRARVESYKANRTDPGAVFRDQRQRVIDMLRAENCTVIIGPETEIDGAHGFAEADDVLAWVQREYVSIADDDSMLRIVSNDGDLEALASESPPVEIYKPGNRREDPVYPVARIRELRGVEPNQIPQLKALKGDSSDNYPGFPGIGDKCAAMLIQRFGTAIDAVASAPDDETIPAKELKANQREALREGGVKLAAQGVWLAALRANLPLDFHALVMDPDPPAAKPKGYFAPPPPAESEPQKQASTEAPQTLELAKNTEVASIAAYSGINPFALQPGKLGDLYDLSLALSRSGLYSHLPNTEAIMGVILDANERGVPAATACRNAYLVPGSGSRPPKLGWSAAYIAGLVLASGKADYFELVLSQCDDKKAVVRFKRKGREGQEFTYRLEDAQLAGLLGKDAWTKNRKAMLRAAATREAARAGFPDVASGVYMPDELRERGESDDDAEAANV